MAPVAIFSVEKSFNLKLSPCPLLQMTKTATHLLSFMSPYLSFFSLSAARHLASLLSEENGVRFIYFLIFWDLE